MLIESLLFAASLPGTPPAHRRHLVQAIGLWARGRRQRRAWAPHLSHTSGLIERTMADLPVRRTVAVLGSGPLLDVPLESLSKGFERVVLVDLVHLLPARRRAARLGNVALDWRDVSATGTPLGFLREVPQLDWVISVNLASQLAAGAQEGAEGRAIDEHLEGLSALDCRATLVTDLLCEEFDRSGRLCGTLDLLHGRALPETGHRWTWDVAPLGEESRRTQRIHSVAGYPDWHKAIGRAR